jgi:hypothetical protein
MDRRCCSVDPDTGRGGLMGDLIRWLSIEELEKLDPHQLGLLKAAIEREISSSDEIKKLLDAKLRPVYDRMASQGGTQAPGTAAPAAPPAPGTGGATPGGSTNP